MNKISNALMTGALCSIVLGSGTPIHAKKEQTKHSDKNYRIVYTKLMNEDFTEYDIFSMKADGHPERGRGYSYHAGGKTRLDDICLVV